MKREGKKNFQEEEKRDYRAHWDFFSSIVILVL